MPGLVLFAVLWGRWFQMGLRFLWQRSPETMQRLGVGLFFCVCGIFLHSLTEWTFRQAHIFLTFNILAGTLASLCYARRHARKPVVAPAAVQGLPELEFAEALSPRAQPCA